MVSLNHPFRNMMLRNRKRQKLAKMKAEEEERKKPKVIPHWKRAAMEALRQEREKMDKANEEKDNQEEADEVVEDSEEKPAYFNDFLAQAKRLDSSLKSSFDLDPPVQRQSSEGEYEVEVGEEIERRSLMKRRLLTVRMTSWKSEERRRSLWPKKRALRSPKALRIAGLRALQTNKRGRWAPQWFQGGRQTPRTTQEGPRPRWR